MTHRASVGAYAIAGAGIGLLVDILIVKTLGEGLAHL